MKSVPELRIAFPGLLLAVGLCLAACGMPRNFAGPMPVRNQHPAQLTVVHLGAQEVSPPPAGGVRAEWRNAYSSLFLAGSDSTGTSSFLMDGEYWRSSMAARVGLGRGLEVGIEIPVGHTSGGFLDEFVIAWHDAFRLPDQGRDRAPRDRFGIEAESGGASAWSVDESSLELLDVPVTAAWNLLPITDSRPFGVSLRGAVEFPTGDADRGYGSGEIDWALGVASELRVDRASFTLNGQYAWAGTPERTRHAGLEFADVWSVGAGVEFLLDETWSVLVQTEYESSTLRRLGFPRVADDQWLLWFGGRARLADRVRLEVGIGEDLSGFVAPDFTAWMMLGIDFGG